MERRFVHPTPGRVLRLRFPETLHAPKENLHHEALRRQIFIEYTNVDMFFLPIEVACWDILGKALGKPVSTLLGGTTAPKPNERTNEPNEDGVNPMDVAYCVGILSPEESRQHAGEVLDRASLC